MNLMHLGPLKAACEPCSLDVHYHHWLIAMSTQILAVHFQAVLAPLLRNGCGYQN